MFLMATRINTQSRAHDRSDVYLDELNVAEQILRMVGKEILLLFPVSKYSTNNTCWTL